MNYQEICYKVQEIARHTGAFIKDERKKLSFADVETKSHASLVTYVDKTAEKSIIKSLKQIIPESGFIAEEGTASYSNEEFKWIIDPLDGTTNYIHGITPYSVSIALMKGEEIVVGVVYEIGLAEMFYAWKGSAAYLNGDEIKVSSASTHEESLISTGFPYYAFDKIDNYLAAMRELMNQTRGIRRFGSAAVDLAYVAAGRFEAFYEHALHAWDLAAGAFLIQQAGGKIADFKGGNNWLFGGELIATNKNYFDEFFGVINKHLG